MELKEVDWMTNRVKKTEPCPDRSHWCNCDRYVVREGQKCRVCGRKNKSKHRKGNKRNLMSDFSEL